MTRTILPPLPPVPPQEEPIYGWRYIERVQPNGDIQVERVSLTLEDVLHPQEGDVIPENPVHEADRRYLSDVFHEREARIEDGLVLSDCIINWGVEGLGNHSPDISVFSGVKIKPPRTAGIFQVRPSGGRCRTAIELVSPHTRRTDVEHKRKEYHQAKVPLYVMVDQKKEGGPRQLRVFRDAPEEYSEERPESVLVAELGVRLGLKDNRVVCWDAETGEELLDYTEERAARLTAEQGAREQKQAQEAAEQARQAAEQARQAAEQARQAAEQQAREQAQARQTAEQARQAAEERIRELEEQLRRASEKGS